MGIFLIINYNQVIFINLQGYFTEWKIFIVRFVDSVIIMMQSTDDSNGIPGEWIIDSEAELEEWSATFVEMVSSEEIILLQGEMGSGKTTLVRYLMKALKGEEASSPTFSLVNEYRYPNGIVYHCDLYRMEEPEELEEIGFEEYLDRGAICLIEWPELGSGYYHDDEVSTLFVEVLPDNRRKLKWIKGIET